MGYYEPNLVKLKDLYRPRMEKAIEILEKELPGAVFPRPEGGFFIGVTLPEGNDMAELIPAAKEAGVLITDGRGFYLNPDDGKRFLRVPFCGLTPEELEAAFALLLPLIKK
jgi:2-aminoadipate transaminase